MSLSQSSLRSLKDYQGYFALFAVATFYGFLCSPYLRDFSQPSFSLRDYFLASDFQNFWTSAHLAVNGKIATLFDFSAYRAAMPYQTEGLIWSYPLHLLVLIAPLGWMPYVVAYFFWTALSLTAFLAAVFSAINHLYPGARKISLNAGIALLLVFSPAVFANIALAQTGLLSAALFLGGLNALLRKKPVLSGILFGLLTVKPQLGLILPFALIVLREWKAFSVAALTTVALLLASVILWGVEAWQQYFTINGILTFILHADSAEDPGMLLSTSIYYSLQHAGLSFATAMSGHIMIAITVLVLTCRRLHRVGLNLQTLCLLALASLILTPYAHGYDYPLAAGGLAIFLFARAPESFSSQNMVVAAIFALLWALPLITWPLQQIGLPLQPLALLGAYASVYTARTPKGNTP